ncbi:MAG: hypothetical protein SCALA701_24710 [Candidatus Scalindua sp.]|nr:hypothetical protein [Planctomycetota bacterium]GJQ59670.1 MAG: hypothetical protein SCALA701_24710 [Candidatus Scalindua sp.]
MKNEILEELWNIKDEIASECGNDVEKLANELRAKEKKEKALVVDFSTQVKPTTMES